MTGSRNIHGAATLEELQRLYARAMADTPSEELADIRELRRDFLEQRKTFWPPPEVDSEIPEATGASEPLDAEAKDEAIPDDDVPAIEVAKPKGRFRSCLGWFFTAWGLLALIRILTRLAGGE